MKNDQEPHAYREANHHPAPDVPVASFLGLIALSHKATLLPAMLQSKGQMTLAGLFPAAPFLISNFFSAAETLVALSSPLEKFLPLARAMCTCGSKQSSHFILLPPRPVPSTTQVPCSASTSNSQ